MPSPSSLLCGNSLARERMQEKAEQDRLEKMNTRQKAGTPLRDITLQHKVLFWMIDVVGEKPKGKLDYDHWLSEPGVLARIIQAVMYNSISMDMVEGPVSKVEKIEDQLELFLKYAKRFGVPEEFLFDPLEDLMQLKDIPRVTRCLALMAKMANVKEFENVTIEIPEDLEEGHLNNL